MKVLDHGHVELVDHMGSDLTVANAARVSFSSESHYDIDHGGMPCLSNKDAKLINYLAKHDHWTPFAHPQITLRIKAPISIRTQCFKHKQGFVENEVSRRYVATEPEFYEPRWRSKPTKGAKQGSDEFMVTENSAVSSISYNRAIKQCMKSYDYLLKRGVAPEQARFVLPQGMYTEWYWTGSLAAYARFYKLRIDSHAQWEVQEYAKMIGEIIEPLFPVSWVALIN